MGHALCVSIKPKDMKVDPILILSYSGNDEIYQLFRENNVDFFNYDDKEFKYKELSLDIIDILLNDINKSIEQQNLIIETGIECEAMNEEIFDEIVSSKKYLKELNSNKQEIEFLRHLIIKCNEEGNVITYNMY